jgi:D-alanyl-D-alanine carboxypeptidase
MRLKLMGLIVVIGLVIGGLYGVSRLRARPAASGGRTAASAAQEQSGVPATAPGAHQPTVHKHKFPTDQAASLWVVANKGRPLKPLKYTPDLAVPKVSLRLSSTSPEMHLDKRAIGPLEKLFAAARKAGYHLQLASGYRSYQEQVVVYHNEVKNYGQAQADRESARPGHSEHQTGLSADVEPVSRQCEVAQCFGATPEGKWLAKNAYQYGFVIRYPKGYQHVTGYEWEPWHLRYVGSYLSKELHKTGTPTLEQFFGLGPAPTYE